MLLLAFVAFWAIVLFHQMYWRRRNLPPGPMPLPFLGNIFNVDPTQLDTELLRLKKKYGNVFTIWMPDPYVVVSDPKDIRDTFVKQGDTFSGRPNFNLMKLWLGGNYGLIFNDDKFWRSQRRFALHVLRDFGFGKPVLEDTVINQADAICGVLKRQKGAPIDMMQVITTAIGNIIYQLTFGTTVDIEDPFIFDLRNTMIDVFELFAHPMGFLYELWTGFRVLDPLFGNILKRSTTKNDQILDFLRTKVQEHRDTINYDGEPRDYIDAFLMEQRKQGKNMELPDEWSDNQLIGSIYDLFGAGMETTSTSTRTFLLHMILNPEVQKKCQEEIDNVIGRDNIIQMSDQTRLPYLCAAIQELQRIAVLLTMNLQHQLTEDASFDGYHLPKGTITIAQFPSVHLDEKQFADPLKFDPTRHLDAEGKFKKDERIIPFSAGKRSCLGESLAKMELFLFCATLLQRFEFLPEREGVMPEVVYSPNLIKSPEGFKTVARLRS